MKRLCLICLLSVAATNVLHSPKALEQVKSLQKVTVTPKTLQLTLPSLAAVLPATINVTFAWIDCSRDVSIMWGTNSGVYQWTNIVSAGTTNITLTLTKGIRYYFAATETNCVTPASDLVYPPFPPTNYYSIYAQTSTNVSGPFSDISTNVLMRFTNNAPQDFFRLRIGVSQSP